MLAIQAGTTDITSYPIMQCYNNDANKAVCLQSVSSNVFNIVDDSISNPSLLTDLKNSSYKVSFVPSYVDNLFSSPAWAASPNGGGWWGPDDETNDDDTTADDDEQQNSSQNQGSNNSSNDNTSQSQTNAGSSNAVWNDVVYAFLTADGFIYGYEATPISSDGVNTGFYIISDVNGTKKPNNIDSDLHKFKIDSTEDTLIDRTCEYTQSCN